MVSVQPRAHVRGLQLAGELSVFLGRRYDKFLRALDIGSKAKLGVLSCIDIVNRYQYAVVTSENTRASSPGHLKSSHPRQQLAACNHPGLIREPNITPMLKTICTVYIVQQ